MKAREMKVPLESEVMKSILRLLEVLGIPHIRSNAGGGYRLGKGGRPQLIDAGPAGWPDITGWLPRDGRFLAIEVKRVGEVPRAEQWAILHRINRDGGVAIWVDSLTHCHEILARVGKGESVTYESDDQPGVLRFIRKGE